MPRPYEIVEIANLFDRFFREEVETGSRCDANQLMLDAMEELGHEPPDDWPAGDSIECKEFDLTFETAWLLAIVLGTR